jgi:hypothetical protein
LDDLHVSLSVTAVRVDDHGRTGVAIDQKHDELAGALGGAVIGAATVPRGCVTVSMYGQRRTQIETTDDVQAPPRKGSTYRLRHSFSLRIKQDTVVHRIHPFSV